MYGLQSFIAHNLRKIHILVVVYEKKKKHNLPSHINLSLQLNVIHIKNITKHCISINVLFCPM